MTTYNLHRTTFEDAVSAILVALTKTRTHVTSNPPRRNTSIIRARISRRRPARRASK